MKYSIKACLLGLVVLVQPIAAIDTRNDQKMEKNGLLAKSFVFVGTATGLSVGYAAATDLCNYITPDVIKNGLNFSTEATGSVINGIRTMLSDNRELLSNPYIWGGLGATVAGATAYRYLSSYTPAGCIGEYKKLFGLDQNLKSFQPTDASDIVSIAKSKGWPLLGFRTYQYHKVAEYLAALSFRCSIAKMVFADNSNDLETILRHVEHMHNSIIQSSLYRSETEHMKVSAQEKIAEAAQVGAHAAHGSTFGYIKSVILNKAINCSGVGLVGLASVYAGYKVFGS